jgi:tetratricopeptide (TPR) repeat protein
MALGLAAVLVAGVGYLKYQSWRRLTIESAVTEKLNNAPSPTLRQAALRVFVSDTRGVTLDGKVPSREDFLAAGDLAASVPGVTHVINRVEYPASIPAGTSSVAPPGIPGESAESLVNQGSAFLDAGDYPAAIECFRKAAADPNNKGAQELLDRAQRAQKTEEELLRKRR